MGLSGRLTMRHQLLAGIAAASLALAFGRALYAQG